MDTLAFLYRDIRGRREDLKPLFIIGGVYDVKNPVFQNVVDVKNNVLDVAKIEGVLYDTIQAQTLCGVVDNQFVNDSEIKEQYQNAKQAEPGVVAPGFGENPDAQKEAAPAK